MKKAVILLSGGLDSSTVLYYAKKQGYSCRCLIFDYGQRHRKEIKSALRIAKTAGSKADIIRFRFPLKNSSLLDKSRKIPVHPVRYPPCPKGTAAAALGRLISNGVNIDPLNQKGLPSTYVPGRNTVFLSFALSFAEMIKASAIFVGANAIDFSGYPDCRPAYFKAWQKLIKSLGMNRQTRGKKSRMALLLLGATAAVLTQGARMTRMPVKHALA